VNGPYTPFTSPWRREVAERSEAGGGDREASKTHPTPTLTAFASTLPLQGRVFERVVGV